MWMDWLKRTLKTRERETGAVRYDERRDLGAVPSSPEFLDFEAVVPCSGPPARELEPTVDRDDGDRWR
jgi:hypothetical protein